MALSIFTSNRMELLVEQLVSVVKQPLASPFVPETIVVQSKGMQRWLAMELARKLGVWANSDFPFPNALIDRIFAGVIPGLAQNTGFSSFHPEPLSWRIMEILPPHLHEPEFGQLATYLADDSSGLKLLQLSQTIADTFDQYTIYRPELPTAWERGTREGWQAVLWRELAGTGTTPHRASLLMQFRRQLGQKKDQQLNLPRRIAMIGIPTLPPFHLEVITAIARHIDVNLFLLNPCRQYWGSIVPERALPRLGQQEFDFSGDSGYFETGNPLLASFGRTGRDFFDILTEEVDASPGEKFADPGADTLLHAIQGDILDLRDRRQDKAGTLAASDESLRIHACHSPMREIEVLYDQLLHRLDRDPTLTPRDILVMTPDIERYAPYISAVFGSPERSEEAIPFSIADRSLRRDGQAAETFLALVDLCGSRFTVPQVLDIAEMPLVLRRFGLATDDLDLIRQWLAATSIRWGIDGNTRTRHGLPSFSENSWRAGLDRLLLGYAMEGNDRQFCHGILPYDHVEGSDTLVLGKFIDLCETLFAWAADLARPRTLAEWTTHLRLLIATFFETAEEKGEDVEGLFQVIDLLEQCGSVSQFSGTVGVQIIRSWLGERLDRQQREFGFLTGGVTFCAMLPMRSIPFRVIALLGMNDGCFPRRNRMNGFDLIAAAPRRGDRNQRDEDRYLFLEAILSCRDHLYISYVGRSIKDNTLMPPAPLVGELINYCRKSFRVADREGDPQAVVDILCIDHPLQPFSPRYFCPDNGQLFSFSQENRLAAFASPASSDNHFLRNPLPVPDETVVNIGQLVEFFGNPCKYLLQRQLGASLAIRHEAMEEEEPFAPDHLCRYALGQEMVMEYLECGNLDLHRAAVASRGILPPGSPGLAIYDRLAAPATEFAAQVAEVAPGRPLPLLEVHLECDGVRLMGTIEGIWPTGLVHYRYAKLKAKDRLRMWIEYLCLSYAAPTDYPRTAYLLASDAMLTAVPVADSKRLLAELLTIYRRGLSSPLPFFPETSFEYAKKAADAKKVSRALADAGKKWHGSDEFPGEKRDPWYRRCFGESEPLDAEFARLSLAVYQPILDHLCEKKQRKGGDR